MSIKTLRKRIALVAVSALGVGLTYGISPASATPSIEVVGQAIYRDGGLYENPEGGSIQIRKSNDAIGTPKLRVITAPTASDVDVNGIYDAVFLPRLGYWTIAVGDGGATEADLGGTTITVGALDIAVASAGTDTNSDGDVGDALEDLDIDAAADGAAGDYETIVWVDTDGDDVIDSTEASTTYDFTVGGAPDVCTATMSTGLTALEGQTFTISVSCIDADENDTVLITAAFGGAATENIDMTDTGAFFANEVSNLDTLAEGVVRSGSTYTLLLGNGGNTKFTIDAVAAQSTGEVLTVTVDTAGTDVSDTYTVTVEDVIDETDVTYVTVTNTVGIDDDYIAGDSTVIVSTAVPTVYFQLTSASAGWVLAQQDVSAFTGTDAADMTDDVMFAVRMNSDGTGVLSITNPTPVDGEGYVLDLYDDGDAAMDARVTVTYADPVAEVNLDPASTFKAKIGTKVEVKAEVADQFGVVVPSAKVTFTVAGRNPSAAASVTAGTDGVAVFSYTDISTSATLLTDTITASYTNATDTYTDTVSVTWSTTGPAVAKIVLTASEREAVDVNSDGDETDTADAALTDGSVYVDTAQQANTLWDEVTYTATVKDANGAPVSGVIVTWTVDAGSFIKGSVTQSVSASLTGAATINVYRQKTGTATVTATYQTISDSNNSYKWYNRPVDARSIAVSSDLATNVSEGTIRMIAKVTDIFGNPVPGVEVAFSENGAGRLATTPAATGDTSVTGEYTVDLVSAAKETGKNTVSASVTETGTQVENLKGKITGTQSDGVGAETFDLSTANAGVKTGSQEVSFTAEVTGVSNAEVLAAIVKLIASINKQIKALQKSLKKK